MSHFKGKKRIPGVRFQVSGQTNYDRIRFDAENNIKNGRIVDWTYEDKPAPQSKRLKAPALESIYTWHSEWCQ